ncbi:MAG: RNA 2',3'-cyclic phosphodiesterase [Candidatus Aminicenantes bacterium]|jgi:2'-5' RNA ligase
MRTFVAIDLEHELKINISQLIKKLDNHKPNIRWIREQGMHLTLKFIGEIPEDKASDIRSVLMDLALKHERFPLKLVGTGRFPPRSQSPRILWVGVEENHKLIDVQKEVELMLEKLAIKREKRKFFPHLTLGRVKSNENIMPVLDELLRNKDTEFGRMEVEKITLFKSTLKPTGAEYSALANIDLK